MGLSADATTAAALGLSKTTANYSEGQIVAFVDVPVDLEPGLYRIHAARRVRFSFAIDAWYAWDPRTTNYDPLDKSWDNSGAAANARIKLEVENPTWPSHAPAEFTKLEAGQYNEWNDVSAELPDLTPLPSAVLEVSTRSSDPPDPNNPTVFPAAGEIEVFYPSAKMTIRGVAVGRNDESSAIVRWDAVPNTLSGNECDERGTLRVHLVDPKQITNRVYIAFELKTVPTPYNRVPCGWAEVDDFSVVAYNLYDLAGVLLDPNAFWQSTPPPDALKPRFSGIF